MRSRWGKVFLGPWATPLAAVACVILGGGRALAGNVTICQSLATSYGSLAVADAGYFLDASNFAAQSFQVAATIELAKVTLPISNQGPSTADTITVQIRTGGPAATNPPGATVLTSVTLNDPMAAYHSIDFNFPPGTMLTAGTAYYIVATGNGGATQGYGWAVDSTSPTYASGQSFTSSNGTMWTSRAGPVAALGDQETHLRVDEPAFQQPTQVGRGARGGRAPPTAPPSAAGRPRRGR